MRKSRGLALLNPYNTVDNLQYSLIGVILNHFNLFGGGYASQANRMIDQILRSLHEKE